MGKTMNIKKSAVAGAVNIQETQELEAKKVDFVFGAEDDEDDDRDAFASMSDDVFNSNAFKDEEDDEDDMLIYSNSEYDHEFVQTGGCEDCVFNLCDCGFDFD
jgi:hypothetical protein